jgi:hypothetical protein
MAHSSTPHVFTLYGTSACHLCEQARALFLTIVPAELARLHEVDISDSDDLLARYGQRIPVLSGLGPSGEKYELGWPFDAVAVGEFVDVLLQGGEV